MVWILVSLRVLWADWTFGRKSLPRTLVQSENVSLCCGQQCRCFLLAEACLRWWVHILSCNLRDRQRRWTLKAPAQRHRLPSASRKLVLKTLCILHIYIYIYIVYTHIPAKCKISGGFWHAIILRCFIEKLSFQGKDSRYLQRECAHTEKHIRIFGQYHVWRAQALTDAISRKNPSAAPQVGLVSSLGGSSLMKANHSQWKNIGSSKSIHPVTSAKPWL